MGVAIIHVVDEEAQTSKDYRCDIRMLLAHMKLLAADLQDVPGHDTEVSTAGSGCINVIKNFPSCAYQAVCSSNRLSIGQQQPLPAAMHVRLG